MLSGDRRAAALTPDETVLPPFVAAILRAVFGKRPLPVRPTADDLIVKDRSKRARQARGRE